MRNCRPGSRRFSNRRRPPPNNAGAGAAFAKAGYELLPGWSYRNMWWVTHQADGAFMARAVHGQRIYMNPQAAVVIVRYASHPVASNSANDPTTLPAFDALARHLMKTPR